MNVWSSSGEAIAVQHRERVQESQTPHRVFRKLVLDASVAGRRWEMPLWIGFLALAGLLVHHSWLTTTPMSAGDWNWIGGRQASTWFPWPQIWDSSTGFGTKTFAVSYLAPLLAISGALARAGVSWGVIEKVLFFWPFAVLSFVTPWVLARRLLGSAAWALLAALIYGANTNLIILGAGHLPIGIAETIVPLVLLAFVEGVRRVSLWWAVVGSLLLAAQAAYEVRIAYLTVLLIFVYLLVELVAARSQRRLFFVLRFALLSFVVFAGTQLYWLLPFITYPADPGLPLAAEPWIAFMRLSHGMTGTHPWWTGQSLSVFHTTDVNPSAFILPLIAFIPLLRRRLELDIIWLSLAALIAAFLLKQTNPPAGEVYEWMFVHFPGWRLFREASKLFFVVALAYAILIPIALRLVLTLPVFRPNTAAGFAASATAVGLVTLLLASPLVPLERGEIGYATSPTTEPGTFVKLSNVLNGDRSYGRVLWLGGAVIQAQGSDHHFKLGSPMHPLVELDGGVSGNDPLSSFCDVPGNSFCYVEPELFRYLLARVGATYVVAPLGRDVGMLPGDVNRQWLFDKVSSVLGPANRLGYGSDSLALWRVGTGQPQLVSAPALLMVEGSTQATKSSLTALESFGLPAVFGMDAGETPAGAESALTVRVFPIVNGGCRIRGGGQFGLLAHTQQSRLEVLDGVERHVLPRAMSVRRFLEWGVYGPFALNPGGHSVSSTDDGPIGPCFSWSSTALDALRQDAGSEYVRNESVGTLVAGHAGRWLEFQQSYDPGWLLNGSREHLLGDGLFNLYLVDAAQQRAVFSFSTTPWEKAGAYVAAVWAVLMLVLLLVTRAHRGSRGNAEHVKVSGGLPLTMTARYTALAGLAFLIVAAIFQASAWWAIPSRFPWLFRWLEAGGIADPYSRSEYYLGIALIVLLSSLLTRCVGFILGSGKK